MNNHGYYYDYWVRSDGVKMYGNYIMVACDLNVHPRGSLVETTLGTGIVCDTGSFTTNGSGVSVDVATSWGN
jgi:3D (Asp-Asp-Asp) domain-containing protein